MWSVWWTTESSRLSMTVYVAWPWGCGGWEWMSCNHLLYFMPIVVWRRRVVLRSSDPTRVRGTADARGAPQRGGRREDPGRSVFPFRSRSRTSIGRAPGVVCWCGGPAGEMYSALADLCTERDDAMTRLFLHPMRRRCTVAPQLDTAHMVHAKRGYEDRSRHCARANSLIHA